MWKGIIVQMIRALANKLSSQVFVRENSYCNQKIGLAEQIESYPCPICANDDRVFMTRAGLEKHAKKEHSEENQREIAELAEQIQVLVNLAKNCQNRF